MNNEIHSYNKINLDGKEITSGNLHDYFSHSDPGWKLQLRNFLEDWWNEDSYMEIKTSGSTGNPKIIRVPKEKMIASARMTGNYFGWKENENALLCLPCEYIAGRMMLVRAMVWNLQLITTAPSPSPLETADESEYDFAAMTPMQVYHSIEKNKSRFEKIKTVIIGGGEISVSLENKISGLKNNCFATYGMTETVSHVALKKLNGSGRSGFYAALPGIRFYLDGRSCLAIDAPALSEEKIITNDIADLLSPVSFSWKGRIDNVINSGGIKLFAEEMERKAEPFITSRFFIAGLPDDILGTKAVLVMEGEPRDTAAIFNNFSVVFSRPEIPKSVVFITRFEETPTGKINRKATLKKAGMVN